MPRDEGWHSQSSSLLRYDADRDGTLTRAELLAGLKTEFAAFDVDHKNCLGPEQVRTINQLRVQQDASQATPLVDWNQDGCVDFNEYSGTAVSLFATLDTDGDGILTPRELGGARPPGAGGQGGGRGGHHHGGGRPPGQ